VATVAELLFIVAAKTGFSEILLVHFAVEGDILALVFPHYLIPPGHQQLHMRGAHVSDRSDALGLIGGKREDGEFGQIANVAARAPKGRRNQGDKDG
jgi:hypothetical protein